VEILVVYEFKINDLLSINVAAQINQAGIPIWEMTPARTAG